MKISESHLEQTALSWFANLGYQILHGPDIAPGESQTELYYQFMEVLCLI